MKICWEERDNKFCSTRSDGRLQNGAIAVSVTLFEQESRSDKFLRVTLPVNVSIGPGTRVTIVPGEPTNRAYVFCVASGCASDYNVTDETISKIKHSRTMIVEAIDATGQVISWMLPVSGFGEAYEGPPANLAKFKSIYESPPKPWKDDTLQPHLRPNIN
jgi:invasion protein IalB